MRITTNELVERIRCALHDMDSQWEGSLSEVEGLDIEGYIRQHLPECIRQTLLTIAPELATTVDCASLLIPRIEQNGSGMVTMPDDCLRVVAFKMKGWLRGVTQFITQNDPLYELQEGLYTRGGIGKPKAVVSTNDRGNIDVSYYSLPAYIRGHQVEKAVYIPLPKEVLGGYLLSPVAADAACNLCAQQIKSIMNL